MAALANQHRLCSAVARAGPRHLLRSSCVLLPPSWFHLTFHLFLWETSLPERSLRHRAASCIEDLVVLLGHLFRCFQSASDSTADLPTISLRSLPDLPGPSPRVTFPLLKLRTHTDIMYCHLGYPRIRVFLRTEAKPYTALSPTAQQAGNPPRGRCGLLVCEVRACETENKGLPLSAVSAAPSRPRGGGW